LSQRCARWSGRTETAAPSVPDRTHISTPSLVLHPCREGVNWCFRALTHLTMFVNSRSPPVAPSRIRFSRMANRSRAHRTPDLESSGRYREQLRNLTRRRLPPQLSLKSRQSLSTSKRHSNHVVPPRLPHLQQLPTLLPTRTSKWPPTSNHGRRSRRLCWLLEQPHWPQDRSLLVCRLRHFPGSNAPTRAHTNHYTGPPS
jgi:hypothetical protein